MYGSTEGAFGAMNTENKVGAVGFIPQVVPIVPMGIIKVDTESGRNF